MYGTRARIGYTSPPLVSEIFPYEFYQMAPEGVGLALATLDVWEHTVDELNGSYHRTVRAARAMGEARIDLIVLGGVPVLSSKGAGNIASFARSVEEETGIPVTTAPEAYERALDQLGSRRIVVVETPHIPERGALDHAGREVLGRRGWGSERMVASTVQPSEAVARLGRELVREHPGADTLWLNWPHRATVDQIEGLEQELGVNVVSATQAIVWHALRKAGVSEAIPGFGRLLREPGA